MNRRRLLPFLCLLLATACATAQGEPGQPLRIGTWNIEFFGNRKDAKLGDRTPDDVSKMGAFVRSLGVAVLAVQEIAGEQPLQQLAQAIGPHWTFVLGTSGAWTDNTNRQSIGFLYDDSRVTLLQCEELLDFPRQLENVPIFHRVPVTACFKDKVTGFDFRAITVHLKAGQKKEDEQKRRLEATILHDWLKLLQAQPQEDQDIVVLGDFNSTYGTIAETALEEGGVVHWLQPKTSTPTIMHFAEPIDQVVPGPGFDEIRIDSFTVHSETVGTDKEAWRKTYSDHFPVTVDIVADRDTDPDARFLPVKKEYRLPIELRAAAPTAKSDGRKVPEKLDGVVVAGQELPIAVGSEVEVRCKDKVTWQGKLLHPLGDWVYLLADGRIVALPRDAVAVVMKK